MGIKIKIRDAQTGNSVDMEVEGDNTMEELIDSTADYWKKDPNAYVLRYGKRLLTGPTTVAEASLVEGDVLELIPDPEGGKE